MNDWMHESTDSRYGAYGNATSSAEPNLPSQYIRRPTHIHTTSTSSPGPHGQASPSSGLLQLGNQIADAGSAKKRWLRQAISEETDPLNANHPSPTSTNNSRPGSPVVECAAPLKKRRLARASMSSEVSNTPPSTPMPYTQGNGLGFDQDSDQDREHGTQQFSDLVSLQSHLLELTQNMAKNPLPLIALPQPGLTLGLGLVTTTTTSETKAVGYMSFDDISDDEGGPLDDPIPEPSEEQVPIVILEQNEERIEVEQVPLMRPMTPVEVDTLNAPDLSELSPRRARYVSRWDQMERSPTKANPLLFTTPNPEVNTFIPISAEEDNQTLLDRINEYSFKSSLDSIRNLGPESQEVLEELTVVIPPSEQKKKLTLDFSETPLKRKVRSPPCQMDFICKLILWCYSV